MTNENDFFRRLTRLGPKKLTMDRVKFAFADAYPELAGHPDRIMSLHKELLVFESAGLVRFPSTKNRKAWLSESNPKLPRWIVLNSHVELENRIDATQVPWLPELAFCSELKMASLIEIGVALNGFLIANRRTMIPVPLRERSLQIFGDEKRLDSLVHNGGLFGGKVPLAVIGAFEVEQPLACELSGVVGKPILVIENHHTFWSFCQWNRSIRQYSAIVYGGGNAFLRAAKAVDDLMQRMGTGEMQYFGDLDWAGIEIPQRFNQTAQRCEFSIEAVPAVPLYDWLLTRGVRRNYIVNEKADTSRILDWLPSRLAITVRELFESSKWIPQESLGTEVLARDFS